MTTTFATLYNILDRSYAATANNADVIAHEFDALTACVVRLTGASVADASEYVIETEYHSRYATITDDEVVEDFALFLASRKE